MNFMQTSTLQLLNSALSASNLRSRVIQSNIANIDTPGYKSKQVVFESELKKALQEGSTNFIGKKTHPLHLEIGGRLLTSSVAPKIVENSSTIVQNNGNNVDLEYEMTALAENTLWYYALVQQTSGYFNKLQEVIKEGR